MENFFRQGMLYDFYGELLTEHQKSIYEDAVYNDMSLGEIAEEHGISRQGVHDLIRRCDKILQGYEDKLHLVERFDRARGKIARIEALAEGCVPAEDFGDGSFSDGDALAKRMEEIKELARSLTQEL